MPLGKSTIPPPALPAAAIAASRAAETSVRPSQVRLIAEKCFIPRAVCCSSCSRCCLSGCETAAADGAMTDCAGAIGRNSLPRFAQPKSIRHASVSTPRTATLLGIGWVMRIAHRRTCWRPSCTRSSFPSRQPALRRRPPHCTAGSNLPKPRAATNSRETDR